ncbi:uncharacterized protein C2845_PM06G08550 [Panicum miliaceum]|uniref:Uncharacterized protein n=1 Tax=Panicum miliaceum TaxID=4540 RepID=A0A3L6R8N3_PANMI|nr:uncharacterized protein C2845_PM06G08550 [Panicum miliaceum]
MRSSRKRGQQATVGELNGFGFLNGSGHIPGAHVRSVSVADFPPAVAELATVRFRALPVSPRPTDLVAGDGFRSGRFNRHAVPPASPGPVAASRARDAPSVSAPMAASRGHGGRRVAAPWGWGRRGAGEDAEAARQGCGAGGRRFTQLR